MTVKIIMTQLELRLPVGVMAKDHVSMLLRITNLQDVNRESMKYNHAYSLWITSVEHLQFLKMSTHHSTSDQDKQVYDV